MKKIMGLAVAATLFAAPAVAQDYSQSPAFGTANLSAGFTPDPYTVDLVAGGSIDVSRQDPSCAGYIANAPDYRLHYSSGSLPLIISATSGSDTTLVINGPDGRWYCNDDYGGSFNPLIRFNSPQSGQYDIWVGTYGSQTASARLSISEIR